MIKVIISAPPSAVVVSILVRRIRSSRTKGREFLDNFGKFPNDA